MRISIRILANNHPRHIDKGDRVEYKVSANCDEHGRITQKIELLYQGRIQGRVCPTYYDGDFSSIAAAMESVTEELLNASEKLKLTKNEIDITQNDNPTEEASKRTKFIVKYRDQSSEPLSMRQAVHEAVKLYATTNNSSSDDLKHFFNFDELPTQNYDVIKDSEEFEIWFNARDDSNPRYLTKHSEIITTSDKDCVVSSQWIRTTFDKFFNEITDKDENFSIEEIA